MNKKAQITLFVIIAIVIIASAITIAYILPKIKKIPSEFQKPESYFLDCINSKIKEAVSILELHGGFIEGPEYKEIYFNDYVESNYLNFLGIGIPYWFYVSDGNFREQIPEIKDMENQISDFLEEEIPRCSINLTDYEIKLSEEKPKVKCKIKENEINVDVDYNVKIKHKNSSITIRKHKISLNSQLGFLYKEAKKIYDFEKKNMFLENYSLDVLHLYAPMTGFELGCNKKTWIVNEVKKEVKEALQENIQFLKTNSDYYSLSHKYSNYFIIKNLKTKGKVNFLYSKKWPTEFKVWPSENGIMNSELIGTQEGLSALGLCFSQYHFIYDLKFPVLIQLRKNSEIFQFPLIVVIKKNKARFSELGNYTNVIPEICKHLVQDGKVYVHDINGKAIENAVIKFKCIRDVCDIGLTKIDDSGLSFFEGKFPQCINGFLIINKDGYKPKKVQISTNNYFISDISLEKIYPINFELENLKEGESALITFYSPEYITSLFYPEQKEIEIAQGYYNVSVYLFKKSSREIKIKGTKLQCIEIPAGGIQGFLGIKKKQCFDIPIEETLNEVPIGGGFQEFYIDEFDLQKAKKIKIKIQRFEIPKTIDDIQKIYESIRNTNLEIKIEK